MITPKQYREKAARYTELARHGNTPDEERGFQTYEHSLTMLADNKQWLTDNNDKLANNLDEMVPALNHREVGNATLGAEEWRILQCLGAALIVEWNTLPTGLQRDLFDEAGSNGELLDSAILKGQIARFLRKHTDGHDELGRSLVIRHHRLRRNRQSRRAREGRFCGVKLAARLRCPASPSL